jgi:L-alanine-DL-glutamate epimerase-like enolase superfamily enzyme
MKTNDAERQNGVIQKFEVMSVDLPFRLTFKHAAAARSVSSSIFIRCTTDNGAVGYGESLPREYVTRESQQSTHELLRDDLLPRLIGKSFKSYQEVRHFLSHCDGNAPVDWSLGERPQTAAWCAVDLALLDSFGHHFSQAVMDGKPAGWNPDYHYSAVISASGGMTLYKTLLKLRVFGIRQVKVKLGGGIDLSAIRTISRALGKHSDVRIDLNMLWSEQEARALMADYAAAGVRSFEQPLPAEQLQEMASLVKETGLYVMADESLNDAASLDRLIESKACNAANVRISKCGGLMAAINRCNTALEAGLMLQVGCQVGESSLLSAAQLALMTQIDGIRYLEGCFSTHLLEKDPVQPALMFGYGGLPPQQPRGYGLGVEMDQEFLEQCTLRHDEIS